MVEKRTPLKAIKEKCLDCSNYNSRELRLCPVTECPLHDFRLGKNPYRNGRKLTEEDKIAFRKRMDDARKGCSNE